MADSRILPPLRLECSHALTGVLAFMHAGAGLMLITLPVPVVIVLPIALGVLWSAHLSIGLHGRRSHARAIVAIEERGGRYYVRYRRDEIDRVCRLQPLFLQPQLALIKVLCDRRRDTLVVVGDAVSKEVFRDWRRHLAWSRSMPTADADTRDTIE